MEALMMRCPARIHSTMLCSFLHCSFLLGFTLMLALSTVSALPDEAVGRVVSVISGDSLGIEMLIGNNRTAAIDSIKLADIQAPSFVLPEGKTAQKYAYSILKNKTVYLDIDDNTSTGRNEWNQLICVIYLMDADYRPVWPPVNRLIVDAGQAQVSDDPGNEFDPTSWWGQPPSFYPGDKRDQLKAMLREQKEQMRAASAAATESGSSSASGLSMGVDRKSSILDKSVSGRISIGYRK